VSAKRTANLGKMPETVWTSVVVGGEYLAWMEHGLGQWSKWCSASRLSSLAAMVRWRRVGVEDGHRGLHLSSLMDWGLVEALNSQLMGAPISHHLWFCSLGKDPVADPGTIHRHLPSCDRQATGALRWVLDHAFSSASSCDERAGHGLPYRLGRTADCGAFRTTRG
jgi:hypothetical protein